MAKNEVQTKDEHENRNAIVTGFLLALMTFIIIFLLDWSSTGFKPIGYICSSCTAEDIQRYNQALQEAIRTNSTNSLMPACPATGLCPFMLFLYDLLPIIYPLYLLLGAILYILILSRSIKIDIEHKFKLRFWAKSLLAAGVFELVLTALWPLIFNILHIY